MLRGMNQSQLAKALQTPITYQQVQKYERGANHMYVSRLYEFAAELRVPIEDFLPSMGRTPLPLLSTREARFLEHLRKTSSDVQNSLVDLLNTLQVLNDDFNCLWDIVFGQTLKDFSTWRFNGYGR
jgi:transcriptional regulator with XRE-family HTH domain